MMNIVAGKIEIFFSYQAIKAYALGVQKNPINKMVLLSTHNICLS